MRVGNCDANTALYAYNTCYIKGMEYCMPVSHFSKAEWSKIVGPAKKIALQKSKMSSTFPSQVLYGSQKYGGFILEEPYTKQGISKVATYMQELSDQSQTGRLISMVEEGSRLELGFNASLAEINWNKTRKYVTKSWYGYLAEFMFESNKDRGIGEPVRIDVKSNTISMPLLRENDRFIMESFVQSEIDPNHLLILNIMRMSIHAITLSDICTTDGNQFTKNAWDLKGSNGLRDDYIFPRSPPHFSKKQIKLWQKSLYKVFGRKYVEPRFRNIHQNFRTGSWIHHDTKEKWKGRYSTIEDRLYIKEGHRWRAYRSFRNTRRSRFYKTEFIYTNLVESATSIATYYEGTTTESVMLESKSLWTQANPILNQTNFIDPYIFDPYKGPFHDIEFAFDESIRSRRILLDEIKIPKDNCAAVVSAIQNGTARLVSDGSYFPDFESGSSAFILTPGRKKKNKLVGVNWVPGTKEDQDPYRSELAGVDGGLSMIAVLIKFFNITEGGIEFALDGESALSLRTAQKSKFVRPRSAW